MKKRSQENSSFWNKHILGLFKQNPEAQLTENRYRALRAVLLTKYPWLESISKDDFIAVMKDADYVARKMRYLTEDIQQEIKKKLSQEKIIEIHQT